MYPHANRILSLSLRPSTCRVTLVAVEEVSPSIMPQYNMSVKLPTLVNSRPITSVRFLITAVAQTSVRVTFSRVCRS